MGVWFFILILAIFAYYIFTKSAFKMGQPPLTSINMAVEQIKKETANRFKRIHRAWVEFG